MRERTIWIIGGAALAAALLLNVVTTNGLWIAYTLVGCAAFAGLGVLRRRGSLPVSEGTLLAAALVAALHYVGGSLAGVHRAFGVNGLYYVFPWWDNFAHLLGGMIAWTAGDAILRVRLGLPERRVVTSVAAVGLALAAGVGVELYEFVGFAAFGTIDQGFYTNTMLDLYYDALGATAAAVAAHRWAVWARAANVLPAAGRKPS